MDDTFMYFVCIFRVGISDICLIPKACWLIDGDLCQLNINWFVDVESLILGDI